MRKYRRFGILDEKDCEVETIYASENGNFEFRKITRVLTVEKEDYEEEDDKEETITEVKFEVISKGEADLHAISIKLTTDPDVYELDKNNHYYQRYEGVEITHGIRMSPSVYYDIPTTKKYIALLEEACNLSERIINFLSGYDVLKLP